MSDATGTRSTAYDMDLGASANNLSTILEIANLKVYDFGFYLHSENFDGGIPAAFEEIISEIESQSQYYILIGRQSTTESINAKFWIDISLPIPIP
ncbi:MAG: hypothetical protein IPL46_25180 [Saprospiraceae bacterium]|nr:hypothetical protein [Saprospiraceae bacterium]